MVLWNGLLYMDDKVKKRPDRYKKIFEKKSRKKAYCIAIAGNENNSLEIYDSKSKWFEYRRREGIRIVGVAADYENALLLVADIMSDVLTKEKDVDTKAIRHYFNLVGYKPRLS